MYLNKEYPNYCFYDDEKFKYNKDFYLYKIKDILEISFSEDVFIRPNKSNKLFNGCVLNKNKKIKTILNTNNFFLSNKEILSS